MFLLSSQPGTGKTFVLGAAIQEMRKSGAKESIYVTTKAGTQPKPDELFQAAPADAGEFVEGASIATAGAVDQCLFCILWIHDSVHFIVSMTKNVPTFLEIGRFLFSARRGRMADVAAYCISKT